MGWRATRLVPGPVTTIIVFPARERVGCSEPRRGCTRGRMKLQWRVTLVPTALLDDGERQERFRTTGQFSREAAAPARPYERDIRSAKDQNLSYHALKETLREMC